MKPLDFMKSGSECLMNSSSHDNDDYSISLIQSNQSLYYQNPALFLLPLRDHVILGKAFNFCWELVFNLNEMITTFPSSLQLVRWDWFSRSRLKPRPALCVRDQWVQPLCRWEASDLHTAALALPGPPAPSGHEWAGSLWLFLCSGAIYVVLENSFPGVQFMILCSQQSGSEYF